MIPRCCGRDVSVMRYGPDVHETQPCGQGNECADPVTGPLGLPLPRWGPAPFCQRDTQLIAQALDELPRLYVELHLSLPRGSTPMSGDHVSGSREQPTPLNLSVDALMRSMVTCLVTWHEVCLEPDLPAGPVRSSVALAAACRALRANLGRLLALPPTPQARGRKIIDLDGRDAGRDLLRLRQRARLLLRLARHVEECPAPCPACSTYGLMRESGSDVIRCETCAHTMTREDYAAWVEKLVGDAAT